MNSPPANGRRARRTGIVLTGGTVGSTYLQEGDEAVGLGRHGAAMPTPERREEVPAAVERARHADGTVVIDFRVQAEDFVYPMVPAGNDLADMIRRPDGDAIQGGENA